MIKDFEKSLKNIIKIGGICAIISFSLILFDIIFGSIVSSDLSTLPQTAVERFDEYHHNWFMGLYHMDFLNVINSLVMIFVFISLLVIHMHKKPIEFGFATFICILGTFIFVTNNTALAMLELSNKYFSTNDITQRRLLAAAGEVLLVRGEHGSLGVFMGFFLSSLGSVLISILILKGQIFSKIVSWFGIIGNTSLLLYVILLAIIPSLKDAAVMIAAPGGILSLIWILLIGIKLMKMKVLD